MSEKNLGDQKISRRGFFILLAGTSAIATEEILKPPFEFVSDWYNAFPEIISLNYEDIPQNKIYFRKDGSSLLVPIGNSLEAGVGQIVPKFGWVGDLAHMLKDLYLFNDNPILETGSLVMAGARSSDILKSIQDYDWKINGTLYPVFCMSLGENDVIDSLSGVFDASVNLMISLKALRQAYKNFEITLTSTFNLLKSLSKESQIIITSIPDFTQVPYFQIRESKRPFETLFIRQYIRTFNNSIRRICKKYKVAYVDLEGTISKNDVYIDGMHPNYLGYRDIAQKALALFEEKG